MTTQPDRPNRLHHNAWFAKDLERTRAFYEEIVGLPLVTTWCEGEGEAAYCHVFFELADGSALAFFQFADAALAERHLKARPTSPFYHIALNATASCQQAVLARATRADLHPRIVDHGYCTSLYLEDPDGMVVELTVDTPEAAEHIKARRMNPRAELAAWLAGDHTPNNQIRA